MQAPLLLIPIISAVLFKQTNSYNCLVRGGELPETFCHGVLGCISQTHMIRTFKQCVTLSEMLKDTLFKSANSTSIRVKGRCVLSSAAF